MKTFNTNELGGMKVWFKDLRFMEQTHKEAFEAIMKPYALLHEVIILSGCERTVDEGDVTIADGFVLYAGEICKVNSHTYPAPTGEDDEYWTAALSTLEFRAFEDVNNTVHPVHQERIVSIEVAISGGTKYSDTPKWFEVVHQGLSAAIISDITSYYNAHFNQSFDDRYDLQHKAIHYESIEALYGDTHGVEGAPNQVRILKIIESRLIEVVASTPPLDYSGYKIHSFESITGYPSLGMHIFLLPIEPSNGFSSMKIVVNSSDIGSGSKILKPDEFGNVFPDFEVTLTPGKLIHFVKTTGGWLWIENE